MKLLYTALFILGSIAFFRLLLFFVLSTRKHKQIRVKWVIFGAVSLVCSIIGLIGMMTVPSSNASQSGENEMKLNGSGTTVKAKDAFPSTYPDPSSSVRPDQSSAENSEQPTSAQPGSSSSEQLHNSSLGMTADEFKNRFNSAVGKYRLNGLNISRLNTTTSADNSTTPFEYVFNDNLRLAGVLDKAGEIHKVTLFHTGNTGEPTGGLQLVAIAVLILTTNEDYTYNDAQDVMQEMGLLTRDVNQAEFKGAAVRGGFEYEFVIPDLEHSVFEIAAAN
ncbi:hypothetical protein [Paenibacillus sp. AN1007]|uniref:Uncharacterized protein n=1 Tax=Paenibacillus sp. AN1007 TaxID=3151385 RepID=A0AAU8N7B5_9BACL